MNILWMRTLIIIVLATLSIYAYGQSYGKLNLAINTGMSYSSDLKHGESYILFSSSPPLTIKNTYASRTKNYNFGLGYEISSSFMINGSIGIANFGYFYSGETLFNSGSQSNIFGNVRYNSRLLEVNLSGIYSVYISPSVKLMIQPGFSWYTNPQQNRSSILRIPQNSNNYSATIFSGFEFPMINDFFFINIGLNVKLPLSNFAAPFAFENTFHPYAIGIQTGIIFRFHPSQRRNTYLESSNTKP